MNVPRKGIRIAKSEVRYIHSCGMGVRSHCRAFTLVEVMVVVAMIALLVAMLIPSLRRAREQSRRVACASNVKQIALIWQMYLVGSQGWFPARVVNANVNFGGMQGVGSPQFQVPKPLNVCMGLKTVAPDARLFICPSDRGLSVFKPSCHEYLGTSYNANSMVIGPAQLQALPTDPCKSLLDQLNVRLNQLPKDAHGNQALRRDHLTTDNSQLVLLGDYGWWNAYYFTSGQDLGEWHDRARSYNLGFMDGHVEFTRVRKGLQVTKNYTVVPFKDLVGACTCQKETIE